MLIEIELNYMLLLRNSELEMNIDNVLLCELLLRSGELKVIVNDLLAFD